MKASRALAAALLVLLALSAAARADSPNVELNGRDFYGEVFTDGGDVYVPLDVVGPLLVGSSFVLDDYDVVLRRCSYHFTPAGGGATVKATVAPCMKRGAAVYGPLQAFVSAMGGSFAHQGDTVSAAYPPAPAVAAPPMPAPAAPSPTPPPPAAGPEPLPATIAMARAEVADANRNVLAGHASIRRVEIYHPVSPDPADVIARTDLAGLKVYVAGLSHRDQVWVAMWPGHDPVGVPVFSRHLSGFAGEELTEGAFFVRLPLSVAAGWHVVRIDYDHKDRVDYRFMTY